MKNNYRLLIPLTGILILFAFLYSSALAQTTPTISYQGVLENNGSPVNGEDTMKILIYNSESGGTPLYTETQNIIIANGIFNIAIGSITPLLPALDFRKQYYLGISVNGGAELSPRSLVSFAPYAFRALIADTASYATQAKVANSLSSGAVSSANGESGSITISGTNGITVSNNPPNIIIGSSGVQSLNTAGGKLTLIGAGGTTITDTGSSITIRSSTFTGGTGIQAIQNTDGALTVTNGSGPVATIGLASQSATTGQALVWNGSAWKPGTVSDTGSSVIDSIKNLQDARDDGSSVYLGAGSGVNNSGKNNNVALGIGALHSNTTGNNNTAIGDSTLYAYNGAGNVAIGEGALQKATSGDNTAIGYQAMGQLTTGEGENTACGYQAMSNTTTPTVCSAFGMWSLKSTTTGAANAAFGWESLWQNTSGSQNCAFGDGAMAGSFTGSANTAVGVIALESNDSGSNNTAVGFAALSNSGGRSNLVAIGDSALFEDWFSYNGHNATLDSATANTAVGSSAMFNNSTGSYNTATGYNAIYANTIGYRNTGLGYIALNKNVSGNDNTAIGDAAGPTTTNLNNTTTLGSGALATASNSVVLGNANVTTLFCAGAYAATTANSANMVVASNGQIMRSTSSARYKTNIHDLDINTGKLYDLRPVSYTSKIDGKEYFGLVAEDVAKVLPELAEYAKSKDVIPGSTSDALIPDAVKYPMLSVLLLDELKKEHAHAELLQNAVESQKAINADLERRLEALEAARSNGH